MHEKQWRLCLVVAVVAAVMGCVASGDVRDGYQVSRLPDGAVAEGFYVDGKRGGHWVYRFPDGAVDEGPYVDGRIQAPSN